MIDYTVRFDPTKDPVQHRGTRQYVGNQFLHVTRYGQFIAEQWDDGFFNLLWKSTQRVDNYKLLERLTGGSIRVFYPETGTMQSRFNQAMLVMAWPLRWRTQLGHMMLDINPGTEQFTSVDFGTPADYSREGIVVRPDARPWNEVGNTAWVPTPVVPAADTYEPTEWETMLVTAYRNGSYQIFQPGGRVPLSSVAFTRRSYQPLTSSLAGIDKLVRRFNWRIRGNPLGGIQLDPVERIMNMKELQAKQVERRNFLSATRTAEATRAKWLAARNVRAEYFNRDLMDAVLREAVTMWDEVFDLQVGPVKVTYGGITITVPDNSFLVCFWPVKYNHWGQVLAGLSTPGLFTINMETGATRAAPECRHPHLDTGGNLCHGKGDFKTSGMRSLNDLRSWWISTDEYPANHQWHTQAAHYWQQDTLGGAFMRESNEYGKGNAQYLQAPDPKLGAKGFATIFDLLPGDVTRLMDVTVTCSSCGTACGTSSKDTRVSCVDCSDAANFCAKCLAQHKQRAHQVLSEVEVAFFLRTYAGVTAGSYRPDDYANHGYSCEAKISALSYCNLLAPHRRSAGAPVAAPAWICAQHFNLLAAAPDAEPVVTVDPATAVEITPARARLNAPLTAPTLGVAPVVTREDFIAEYQQTRIEGWVGPLNNVERATGVRCLRCMHPWGQHHGRNCPLMMHILADGYVQRGWTWASRDNCGCEHEDHGTLAGQRATIPERAHFNGYLVRGLWCSTSTRLHGIYLCNEHVPQLGTAPVRVERVHEDGTVRLIPLVEGETA